MKLNLTNGTVLHVSLEKDYEGDILIRVADSKEQLKDDAWYLASITNTGILQSSGYLQGNIKDGLQYDSKTRGIKVQQ